MSQVQPLTVLIVDDELPLREELRSLPWSDFGAELVGEAEHGEEALIACDRLLPDVVITDITMPVMDGFELFRALKSKHPLTQVILLTCHSEFHFAREALTLGALEYLVKMSFGDKELGQALDKAREAIRRERNARMSERSRWRWELSFRLSRAGDGPLAEPLPLEREIAYPLRVVRLHTASNAEDRVYALQELHRLLEEREWAGALPGLWMPCGESDIVLLAAEARCALSGASEENGGVSSRGADAVPYAAEARCALPAACCEAGGADRPRERVIVSWTEGLMNQLYAELEKRLPYLSGSIRLYAVVSGRVEAPFELPGAIRQAAPEAGMLFYDPPLTAQLLPAPEPDGQAIREEEWERIAGEWRAAASSPETGYVQSLGKDAPSGAGTAKAQGGAVSRKRAAAVCSRRGDEGGANHGLCDARSAGRGADP